VRVDVCDDVVTYSVLDVQSGNKSVDDGVAELRCVEVYSKNEESAEEEASEVCRTLGWEKSPLQRKWEGFEEGDALHGKDDGSVVGVGGDAVGRELYV
jgi:hypothetical protein